MLTIDLQIDLSIKIKETIEKNNPEETYKAAL